MTWLLQHSYPQRTVAQLTADARAAGINPATGNVKNWSAIAATQAAIWHHTNGAELDVTRYADPTAALASSTADGFDATALVTGSGAGWRAGVPGEATIDLTFPAPVELRSFSVTSLDGGTQGSTPTAWRLQRTVDGTTWSDVPTSGTSYAFAGGDAQTRATTLGASATYGGYSRYRLVLAGAADPGSPVEIGGVQFSGFGVFGNQPNLQLREYANESEVVHLYRYLLAGAEAGAATPAPWTAELTAPETTFLRERTTDVVGPLTYDGDSAARVTATGPDGVQLLGTQDGALVDELVLSPGETFWLFPGEGEEAEVVLTAVGSAQNWVSARALNGTQRSSGAETLTLTQLGIASRTAEATLTLQVAPVPDPTLSLSVAEGYAGDLVTVTGGGFGALEQVALTLHSDPIALAIVDADDDGAFVAQVSVPAEAEVGDHAVRAVGVTTSRNAEAPFAVLEREIVDPGDGETTDPGDGETTDPGDGETTDPGDGETTDPGNGETTDPGAGETSAPGTASPNPSAPAVDSGQPSPTSASSPSPSVATDAPTSGATTPGSTTAPSPASAATTASTSADLPSTGSSTSGAVAALAALTVLVGVGILVARRVRLT